MNTATASQLSLISRIASGVLGGYAFTWGCVALIIAGSYAAGMEFHDSEALGYILGFLVFLGVFLWAFAARSVTRVWLVLAGGGALMAGVASVLQRSLL